MNKQKKFILFIVLIIIIIGVTGFLLNSNRGPKKNYDTFAQCLSSAGAEFYGTFWCPHCQNQKKAFGDSFKYVNYIECSTPNGMDQLDICKEKNIQGYPTWIFQNGERVEGEISFETLSDKTKCELPK